METQKSLARFVRERARASAESLRESEERSKFKMNRELRSTEDLESEQEKEDLRVIALMNKVRRDETRDLFAKMSFDALLGPIFTATAWATDARSDDSQLFGAILLLSARVKPEGSPHDAAIRALTVRLGRDDPKALLSLHKRALQMAFTSSMAAIRKDGDDSKWESATALSTALSKSLAWIVTGLKKNTVDSARVVERVRAALVDFVLGRIDWVFSNAPDALPYLDLLQPYLYVTKQLDVRLLLREGYKTSLSEKMFRFSSDVKTARLALGDGEVSDEWTIFADFEKVLMDVVVPQMTMKRLVDDDRSRGSIFPKLKTAKISTTNKRKLNNDDSDADAESSDAESSAASAADDRSTTKSSTTAGFAVVD